MRVLLLATDVYGGHGGIALYTRDLAAAIAAMPGCEELVVVPRIIPRAPAAHPVPAKVTFLTGGARSQWSYLRTIARLRRERFEVVICGHLNLLPVARAFAPDPVLFVYGIEAWRPPSRFAAKKLIGSCRRVVSISEITLDRFLSWSGYGGPTSILPNAIRAEQFGIRAKRSDFVARYGLEGKRVLLTVGRVVAAERYKGFDEVIDVLPQLPPDVVYLVAGGGDDILRLRMKAARLGVANRVIFTGEFAEEDKPDLFALADVYVMPSRGEGFGFVFLEALASGVPVIGSCLDGGREALLGGELGLLVDPTNPSEVVAAIEEQLPLRSRHVASGLAHFSFDHFMEQVAILIGSSLGNRSQESR